MLVTSNQSRPRSVPAARRTPTRMASSTPSWDVPTISDSPYTLLLMKSSLACGPSNYRSDGLGIEHHAAYTDERRPDRRRSQMSARTMRAYVLTAPEEGSVQNVPAPVAGAGEVVVDVERVGVCGTDVEFYTGEMAYLHQGFARYPMRLGHEWCGTVSAAAHGVDPAWLGRRVTGDTMLGCGQCRRCVAGLQHVCADRF